MDDDDDEKPIKPMTRLSEVPSTANRIAEIKKYRGQPDIRMGLCPSCLDSGFVHIERKGTLGVLYQVVRKDQQGRDVCRLVRCSCSFGIEKGGPQRLDVKQFAAEDAP